MTGGQVSLSLDAEPQTSVSSAAVAAAAVDRTDLNLIVIAADDAELDAHDAMLEHIRAETGRAPLWDELAANEADIHQKSP